MTEKTELQVLVDALAVIEQPEHWTVDFTGRRADGTGCSALDPQAVRFCAFGAFQRTCRDHGRVTRAGELLDAQLPPGARRSTYGYSYIDFNNNHTHAEVVSLFRAAIESERAKSRQPDISIFTAMLTPSPERVR